METFHPLDKDTLRWKYKIEYTMTNNLLKLMVKLIGLEYLALA